jgi:hypothetical protein
VTRSPANVAVLTRAYPRAVPGALRQVQADVRSGALVVAGTADRAGTDADLWVPERCAAPDVAGAGLGPATARRVDGGWRIAVPIPAAGDYRIAVTCAATGTTSSSTPPTVDEGEHLPATGSPSQLPLVLVLLGLAALARRLSRTG